MGSAGRGARTRKAATATPAPMAIAEDIFWSGCWVVSSAAGIVSGVLMCFGSGSVVSCFSECGDDPLVLMVDGDDAALRWIAMELFLPGLVAAGFAAASRGAGIDTYVTVI